MIAHADGTPIERYEVPRTLNREFVAIAQHLHARQTLGVYHCAMSPPGIQPLPQDARFRIDPPRPVTEYNPPLRPKGVMLGYFGPATRPGQGEQPTHVVIVNLDYEAETVVGLAGPASLEIFDAATGTWSRKQRKRVELRLPRGGGKLARIGV